MFKNYQNYEVYEDGRIWSYKTKKFLKPTTLPNGYQVVTLYDNEGIKKMYKVHRIVYEAVSGEPIKENLEVNHISEDKTENFFANLELMSRKENINWGTGIERRAKANTNNPKRSKQVGAFKNDELVMVFPSTGEAQRAGFDKSNISRCCNGKLPHYKGYNWKYI